MFQGKSETSAKKEEREAHYARMQAAALAPELSSADMSTIIDELKDFSGGARKKRMSHGRKIIAAGYYYSGSGALLDFVADHDGAISWPSKGEVRFINLPWGVNELYEGMRGGGRLGLQAVVRLYLHLRGKIPVNVFEDRNKIHLAKVANRASRLAMKSDLGRAHSYAVKELISTLVNAVGCGEGDVLPVLVHFFQRYDSELRRLSGASVVAYDRAIPPQELQRRNLLGPEVAIMMVHRDPRSQFVDITHARAERAQSVMTAERFIRLIQSRRHRALEYTKSNIENFDQPVALISFEDLVTSCRARVKIREILGLAAMPYSADNFLPEASKRNMMNYEGHADQASIRAIEAALPQYLWPSGELCGSMVVESGALRPL